MKQENYKRGRGSQINPHNKFLEHSYETEEDYLEFLRINGEDTCLEQKTKYIEVFPKTIVNYVNSPDIGATYSMNPYQGCEHGCTYCYARNTHEYWGYSAGSEFEQIILVKKNAPLLLEKTFQKPSWEPTPIMLSGNTDCYQPAEKRFQLTRKMLKILLKYKHPVGMISKNALITRDLDLLVELSKLHLVSVSISINSLTESLRRVMEPRTATVKRRIETVKKLAEHGIPVNVMVAPIVPGLNSHEIMNVTEAVAKVGAGSIGYTVVRLNGQISKIFMDWLERNFPDRAQKVKHQIEACHNGKLNDSRFGVRMRGEGEEAEQIAQMVALAKKKFFPEREREPLNCNDFIRIPKGQYKMF